MKVNEIEARIAEILSRATVPHELYRVKSKLDKVGVHLTFDQTLHRLQKMADRGEVNVSWKDIPEGTEAVYMLAWKELEQDDRHPDS